MYFQFKFLIWYFAWFMRKPENLKGDEQVDGPYFVAFL